jgi:hypothetical protein
MKFTLSELCKAGSYNPDVSKLEPWQKRNGENLVLRVNALGYGPAKKATSFARDIRAQQRINPSATNSAHLYFGAADIGDENQELQKWLGSIEGQRRLVECGLWVEDFSATKTWVHLQIFMPASGNRFFMP